jgi:hypothetical protein
MSTQDSRRARRPQRKFVLQKDAKNAKDGWQEAEWEWQSDPRAKAFFLSLPFAAFATFCSKSG